MKPLTFKLIFPLTIISFATITKWWYTVPIDAPDTIYLGFPFPFVGEAWHTSMALQFFVLEFVVDLIVYFLICSIVIFCINRFLIKIKMHKIQTISLWIISGLIISWAVFIVSRPNNVFHHKRTYEMKIFDSGIKFIWQYIGRTRLK